MESRRQSGFACAYSTPQRCSSPSIIEKSNGACTPISNLCSSLASAVISENLVVENTSDSWGLSTPITPRRNPRRSCAKETPDKQINCRTVQNRRTLSKLLPQNIERIYNTSSSEFKNLKCSSEDGVVAVSKNNVLEVDDSGASSMGKALRNNGEENAGTKPAEQTPTHVVRDHRQKTGTPECSISNATPTRANCEPVISSTPINKSSVKAKRRTLGTPKTRSARKSCGRQKLNVSEYDPAYDIFMDNEMFVQYDIESLKCEIGNLITTCDHPTFKAKLAPMVRSSSCGENLNYLCNEEEAHLNDSVEHSSQKSSKTNTKGVHKKKKLQKASSVPDLREPKSTETRKKITSVETLWSLQDARLTLRRMAQRTKQYLTFKRQKAEEKGQSGSCNTAEGISQKVEQDVGCFNANNANFNPNSSSEDLYWCPTQPISTLILSDVVAYVEVVSGNEDRSLGVKHQLKEMGATVVDNFTKDVPVTHVIFHDGLVSTYNKAIKRKIPLVSVLWIDECKRAGTRVCERLYLSQNVDQYKCPDAVKKLKKRKIIHPYSGKTESPSGRQLRQKPRSENNGLAENSKFSDSLTEKTPQSLKSAVDTGDRDTVDFLANIAGIGRGEVQEENSCNSSAPDIEFATPLAVRLLRKIKPSKEDTYPKSSSIVNDDNLRMECDTARRGESESRVMKENFPEQDMSESSMRRKRKLFSPCDDKIDDINTDSTSVMCIENPHLDACSEKKQRKKDHRRNNTSSSCKETNKSARSSKKCTQEVPGTSRNRGQVVTISNTVNNFSCVRRSRRSSLDFITVKRGITTVDSHHMPGIVCTLLHTIEVDVVVSVIDKLGGYVIEKNVTSCTTHIVTGSAKRTLKVLKGMARGCWIVSQEWILKSLEEGKWLDEEEFEMTSFSPAVQKFRLEKVEFGTMFRPDIFSACGSIFISPKCRAPRADVAELITLCGGQVVAKSSRANILVGASHTEPTGVDACWVFDSITSYSCKPLESYIL